MSDDGLESASAAEIEAGVYAIRGVKRRFKMGSRRVEVLRGVDLDIHPGDFLAIRGSSGTGKSTFMHILGLLDRPDEGTQLFDGVDLARAPERKRNQLRARDFAFVFQFYYLLPEFSALENVVMASLIAGDRSRALSGANRKQRRGRGRVLLERVGLSERESHRPGQLSGGERQRVAIARALMNDPRIVFCDEPTGNLDSRTAVEIHELLCELNETTGRTIVVVTHEPAMAAVARRVVCMADGVIVDEAAKEEGA